MKKRGEERRDLPFLLFLLLFGNALIEVVGGRCMERVFGQTTGMETCGKRVATSERELDF